MATTPSSTIVMVNPYKKDQQQKEARGVHWHGKNGDFGKNGGKQGGRGDEYLTGFTPETPRKTTPKNNTAPVPGLKHHWRNDSPANVATSKQGPYKIGPTQDSTDGYYDGSACTTWSNESQKTPSIRTYATPVGKPRKNCSNPAAAGRARNQVEYICQDDFINSIYEAADASDFLRLPTQQTSSDDESNGSVELVGVRKGRRGKGKKVVRIADKKPAAKKAAMKKPTVNKKPTAKRKIPPMQKGTDQGGTWVNVFIPDGDVEKVFKKMFQKCFKSPGGV